MRIDLQCPYEDKHLAKGLGAKWDPVKKVWYITNPVSLTPFARWVREDVHKFYKPKKKKIKAKKKPLEAHVKKFKAMLDEMDAHLRSI